MMSIIVRAKKSSQTAKDADKAAAFKDNKKVIVIFDLESVLQIPSTDVSPLYYSRKLCMYNLTIHNAVKPHAAFCYYRTQNSMASTEVVKFGICLYNYLTQLPKESV